MGKKYLERALAMEKKFNGGNEVEDSETKRDCCDIYNEEYADDPKDCSNKKFSWYVRNIFSAIHVTSNYIGVIIRVVQHAICPFLNRKLWTCARDNIEALLTPFIKDK